MKKFGIIILSALGVLGVLACLGVVTSVLTSDDPPPAAVMVDQSPATQKAAPKPSSNPWISDGDWLVGKDVKAGTYRSPGASDKDFPACAWAVKASENQDAHVVQVGGTDKNNAPQRAVLKNGQVFQTTGCGNWVKQ